MRASAGGADAAYHVTPACPRACVRFAINMYASVCSAPQTELPNDPKCKVASCQSVHVIPYSIVVGVCTGEFVMAWKSEAANCRQRRRRRRIASKHMRDIGLIASQRRPSISLFCAFQFRSFLIMTATLFAAPAEPLPARLLATLEMRSPN